MLSKHAIEKEPLLTQGDLISCQCWHFDITPKSIAICQQNYQTMQRVFVNILHSHSLVDKCQWSLSMKPYNIIGIDLIKTFLWKVVVDKGYNTTTRIFGRLLRQGKEK